MERTIRHGLPVTTPHQTLLDLAATEPPRTTERALNEAHAQRLVTPVEPARLPGPARANARQRRLEALVEGGEGFTRQEAERRLRELIRKARFHPPRHNAKTTATSVDVLWPDHDLVVEVDGHAFHSAREAVERDHRTTTDLTARGFPSCASPGARSPRSRRPPRPGSPPRSTPPKPPGGRRAGHPATPRARTDTARRAAATPRSPGGSAARAGQSQPVGRERPAREQLHRPRRKTAAPRLGPEPVADLPCERSGATFSSSTPPSHVSPSAGEITSSSPPRARRRSSLSAIHSAASPAGIGVKRWTASSSAAVPAASASPGVHGRSRIASSPSGGSGKSKSARRRGAA